MSDPSRIQVPRLDVKRFLTSLPLAGPGQREGGGFSCINKRIISHPVMCILDGQMDSDLTISRLVTNVISQSYGGSISVNSW